MHKNSNFTYDLAKNGYSYYGSVTIELVEVRLEPLINGQMVTYPVKI